MTASTHIFGRLAELAQAFETEDVGFDEYLWNALYDHANGEVPEPGHIVEITHLWATSPEGYGSTDIAFLARLHDDRWTTCVAWSDTSGFDCRGAADWRIFGDREQAISQGLDKESRTHLGLSLPGEESN